MSASEYPKPPQVVRVHGTLLQPHRKRDKVLEMPRDLPCNIIMVHGVNDVGTGYSEAEAGLCEGLEKRLFRRFKPASYRLPNDNDRKVLCDDPDAVFFKRSFSTETDSPVIPFYWGYREISAESRTLNGQKTDRYGNRLDKDLSKGGGPFGNATSTLPDMWNAGTYAPVDPVGDALRPIKTAAGRMYMVLAACRLAALISMVRDYEPNDTVNIVAHSQGCLLSLLAQAMLMEAGERTADTLILTHPPYSLDEEVGITLGVLTSGRGGEDDVMKPYYGLIDGRQTTHARLQTLVNIVAGVARSKVAEPTFAALSEDSCGGMVEARWKPDTDRDNRGKVYLYFCPEDMTVALDNVRGIGWQGVPDYIEGTQFVAAGKQKVTSARYAPNIWADLGPTFLQRVFTAKRRLNPATRKVEPELVGKPFHDFALRIAGEDDHAHVAASGRSHRASHPVAHWPIDPDQTPQDQRRGVRRINGDSLPVPCEADMRGHQVDASAIPSRSMMARLSPKDCGPAEAVNPIDAAIALTGSGGVKMFREILPADVAKKVDTSRSHDTAYTCRCIEKVFNENKHPKSSDPNDHFTVTDFYLPGDGTIMVAGMESPNAARLRWQNEFSAKSFHSAIFDSRHNHRHVTAYDVSIGSGKASSDRQFYTYLCAVADWRCTIPRIGQRPRPGILTWSEFAKRFADYYVCEPDCRQRIIRGNADYYSSGILPKCLPVPKGKLWDIVVSETTSGCRVDSAPARNGHG